MRGPGKSCNPPKGPVSLCPSLRLGLHLEQALTQAVTPACLQDTFCPSLDIIWEVRAAQKTGVDTEGQDLGEPNTEARAFGEGGRGVTTGRAAA